MDEIEGAQRVRKVHGIALPERDTVRVNVVRETSREWFRRVCLAGDLVGKLAVGLQREGSLDERVGVVDADDFPAGFG